MTQQHSFKLYSMIIIGCIVSGFTWADHITDINKPLNLEKSANAATKTSPFDALDTLSNKHLTHKPRSPLPAPTNQPQLLPSSSKKPLVIGIFPRRNVELTYQNFIPLTQYLSKALKREVILLGAKNFKQFWQNVVDQRYDLVHYNQYHYIISHLLYNHKVILKNNEFNNATIAGSIIVRKDSGINTLADLKNKTILFGGGKMAMQSYIAVKWLLRNGGLKDKDYYEKISLNPPNAVMSTFHKRADAAGSGDVVIQLDVVARHINISEMKILAKTQALAHLPWATTPSLNPKLSSEIQHLLSNLHTTPTGQAVLAKAKLSSLDIATDSDYNQHRKIVREVYGDNYGIETFQ